MSRMWIKLIRWIYMNLDLQNIGRPYVPQLLGDNKIRGHLASRGHASASNPQTVENGIDRCLLQARYLSQMCINTEFIKQK
jgi:hypothetical protein